MKNLISNTFKFTLSILSIVVFMFEPETGMAMMSVGAVTTHTGFSFKELQPVIGKLANIFSPDNVNKHRMHTGDNVFNEITNRQGLRLLGEVGMTLQDGKKCKGVSVTWLENCGSGVEDCDTEIATGETYPGCEFTADTNTVMKSTQYSIECLGVRKFAVDTTFCNSDYTRDDVFAEEWAAALYDLDQDTRKKFIAFLIANRSTIDPSALQGVGGLNADGDIWNINMTDMKPETLACLKLFARKCKMINPIIVAGELWEKEKMLAGARTGNGCCNLESLLGSSFPMFHDIDDLDTLAGFKTFFLVDAAALGYVNSYDFKSPTPMQKTYSKFNKWVWNTTSPSLTWRNNNSIMPIRYDMERLVECVNRNEEREIFRATHHGAFLCAPSACGEDCGPIIQISVGCPGC